MNVVRSWGPRVLPPVLFFLLVLAGWDLFVRWTDVKPYLLPSPERVFNVIMMQRARLADAVWLTGFAAVTGFLASLFLGTLVGCLFSQSAVIRATGYPYAIFLQTVPIIAIAPLIILWCGRGFLGVVVVAFIISVFPVIASATAGLVNVDPEMLDLFRLNRATRWQTLWRLRLPSSVPDLCTGARTASGLAVVGAVVGEFYAGYGVKRVGLGYLIRFTTDQARTDELFAAVLATTLLGIGIFVVVNLISSTLLARWTPEEPHGGAAGL